MPPKGTAQSKGKQPKASSSASSASASKSGPVWVAPKAITHPEHHHTLNHLHQVAAFYAVLSSTSNSASASSEAACRLQGEMVRSAKVLSRKAVIRLDTGVKRGACPRCDTVWMEGLTVHVRSRVSGPHGHVIKWKCGVCGALVRRPAPDLVPQLDEGREKSKEKQSPKLAKPEDHKIKRPAQEKEEEEKQQQKKTKISQRQRRRSASIKRQLLRAAEPAIPAQQALLTAASAPEASTDLSDSSPAAPAPAPAPEPPAAVKLSRGQKRKQRLEKLGLRIATGAAPQNRGRRKIPGPRPHELRVSLSYPWSDDEYYDEYPRKAITVSSTCSTPPLSPGAALATNHQRRVDHAGKSVRTQRPQLPHFNDRTELSHWDTTFTTLHNHLHPPASPTAESSPDQHGETHDPVTAFSCQALQYWEKAARSRGDHRLITGVGKNGALGPTLP